MLLSHPTNETVILQIVVVQKGGAEFSPTKAKASEAGQVGVIPRG
jgi:hypothetical protein